MQNRLNKYLPAEAPWAALNIYLDGVMALDIQCKQQFVSNDVLTSLHPALPSVIAYLKRERDELSNANNDIEQFFEVLEAGAHFVDAYNVNVAVLKVRRVMVLDEDVLIDCDALAYETKQLPDVATALSMPTGNEVTTTMVKKAWLDEHFPGWVTRFYSAKDLGMDLTEALAQALNYTAVVSQVNLPDELNPN